MPTHPEAVRLNLEYYRKQAKALLKSARSGDSAALARLRRHKPDVNPDTAALHEAQLTVAREQGFPSWPRFRTFIIQSALDFQGLVNVFIEAALSDRRQAEEMLERHPELASAGLYTALVLGDARRVEEILAGNPVIAVAKGGPQNWEPLLYVCFSRVGHANSGRAEGLAATARLLLERGANPNAFYMPEEWPDNPLPCLYGATGLNNNAALAQVLLEAGANPNDTESLYHSTEHRDLSCMKLLLANGAAASATHALKHMLDREEFEGLKLLLDAGANPNDVNDRGETALHWAVWRGRGTQISAALVDSGADINARRNDGRTAYAMAVLSGQQEVAALLESRGANTDLSPIDRFVGAWAIAGPAELVQLLAGPPPFAPGNERLLPDLATSHRTAAVRALLAAGAPVDARGEAGATALHWSCWKGYADLAELLIRHGASLTIEDEQFHGTPPGWFAHGLHNCGEQRGDYAAVARVLLDAVSTIPAIDLPTGVPEVDAVLRERGVIE